MGQAKARVLAIPENCRVAYRSGFETAENLKRGLVDKGVDLNVRDETFSFMRRGVLREAVPIEIRLSSWLGMREAWNRYYPKR